MPTQSSEIVVGIDFGTTHSGVAWAINGASKEPEPRHIKNWPDPAARNASRDKVPSVISYKDGRPKSWGYMVDSGDESFKWFKILLEDNHDSFDNVNFVIQSKKLLRKLNKTAQGVVADYLKLLWGYTLDDIKKIHPDYQIIFTFRVILTVPAIWSDSAKHRTLQAAKAADLPRDIELVSEPEAAALALFKDKEAENPLQVGDVFILCDAGGGTVDLISYEIQRLEPLKLKECVVGTGGLCGSIFLDTRFQEYIEMIVGREEYNNIKVKRREGMMKEFEYGIKRCFDENSDRTYGVDLAGVKDDPSNDIIDDTIKVSNSTLRTIFDKVFLKIEGLISEQKAAIDEQGLKAKSILLVGGFGENGYLYNRLVKCHGNDGIQVMQVNGAWSAVCRGAAFRGLDPSGITSRLSRYSYGFSMNVPYDSTKHLEEDSFFDEAENGYLARRQMHWLLKRGDTVEEGRVLVSPRMYCHVSVSGFMKQGEQKMTCELYYNQQPEPPTRRTMLVSHLCTAHFTVKCNSWWQKSFRSKANNQYYSKVEYDFLMILGSANFRFEVKYNDQVIGQVEEEYVQKLA